MKMRWIARIQMLLFGGFFFGLAFFMGSSLLLVEANEIKMLNASVQVPATVVSTNIEESQQETHGHDGTSSTSTVYEGIVTYKYKYKGSDYESSQRAFERYYSGIRSMAEGDIAPYKAGQEIKAFIDPSKPGNAVLSRSIGIGPFAMFGFLTIFALFGGSIMLMGLVGVGDSAKATAVQEVIFDSPVVIWALAICQQFYTYFSNCSPPYPVWTYVLIAVSLAFFAFLVRWRLIGRGLAPGFNGKWNDISGRGSAMTFGSSRPGIDSKSSRSSGFSAEGFGSRSGSRGGSSAGSNTVVGQQSGNQYGQPQITLGNENVALTPGMVNKIRMFGWVPVALFFAFNLYRILTFTHSMDDINPELRSVGSKEAAIAQIPDREKAVREQSDNIWSYKQRGTNYFDAGQYDKALPDLNKTIAETKPPNDEALLCRVHIYMLTEQWAKALADYQTLAKYYHKPYDKYYDNRGMGVTHYKLQKYKEGVADFTKALDGFEFDDDSKQELYNDRALCYDHLGKADLAKADRAKVSLLTNKKWWLK